MNILLLPEIITNIMINLDFVDFINFKCTSKKCNEIFHKIKRELSFPDKPYISFEILGSEVILLSIQGVNGMYISKYYDNSFSSK